MLVNPFYIERAMKIELKLSSEKLIKNLSFTERIAGLNAMRNREQDSK